MLYVGVAERGLAAPPHQTYFEGRSRIGTDSAKWSQISNHRVTVVHHRDIPSEDATGAHRIDLVVEWETADQSVFVANLPFCLADRNGVG